MAKIYKHSGSHLYLLLWKASHTVMRFDEKSVVSQGFASLSDFAVLEVLLHMGSLPVNTIGQRVFLTSGSITTAINRLERRELVVRVRSKGDGRVVLVQLTRLGQDLIERCSANHADKLEELFESFSEEERDQFVKLISKLDKKTQTLSH